MRSHYENILSRKEIQRNSEEEIAKFFSPREDGENTKIMTEITDKLDLPCGVQIKNRICKGQ